MSKNFKEKIRKMGFEADEFRRLDDFFERWFLRISFTGAPIRR